MSFFGDGWVTFCKKAAKPVRYFCLILLVTFAVGRAFADGGSVQLHGMAGRFLVTLFAEPPTVRAGQVDLSALIQDSGTAQPVLDAAVTLQLRPVQVQKSRQPAWSPPSCAVEPPKDLNRVALVRSGAANRLLYGAQIEIPSPGTWHVRADISQGSDQATLEGDMEVAPALPPAAAYWPFFCLPIAVIGIYVLRNWAVNARERAGTSANEHE
ncbi:MAG: hypothetical protein JO333_05155 [Verrucomicrobia bacterium]|nr:hypothetical protein [Verrucomicrobiota bacterium]